jgi:hypothetical protein
VNSSPGLQSEDGLAAEQLSAAGHVRVRAYRPIRLPLKFVFAFLMYRLASSQATNGSNVHFRFGSQNRRNVNCPNHLPCGKRFRRFAEPAPSRGHWGNGSVIFY